MSQQFGLMAQATDLYFEALRLLDQQEFSQALDFLQQAGSLTQSIPGLYFQLSLCYGALGEVRKGIKAALDALIQNPYHLRAVGQLEKLHAMRTGNAFSLLFDENTSPEHWPAISLCMIVKNEENNLAACLDSIKDLVSEIIVVDTGSTDRTMDIARSYGARVEMFSWTEDFAAARNAALRYAQGEWVLVLDADDRLEPKDIHRLKWAAATGKADAYYGNTVSHREGEKLESNVGFIRLYRNKTGLEYQNPLHETIEPSAIRLGLAIADTNIQIQHWGYHTSSEGLHRKHERNLSILSRAVEKDPKDLFSRIERAMLLITIFNREEEGVWELEAVLPDIPDRMNPNLHLAKAYAYLIGRYVRMKQLDKLRWVLEQSLVDVLFARVFWVYNGFCTLTVLGDGARAAGILRRAVSLPVGETDVAYFEPDLNKTLLSNTFLAKLLVRSYLVSQQGEQARKTYLEMLAKPDHGALYASRSTLKLAQQFIQNRKYMDVLQILAPVHPKDSETLRLLGLAEGMLEVWSGAADHFTAAIALNGARPGDWVTLGVCELRLGNSGLARAYAQLALNENLQDPTALEILRSTE